MGVLGINRSLIKDFVASDSPCMTMGLSIFEERPVIFIGFKPDREINISGVDVLAVSNFLPGLSNIQLHFILDDSSYYYAILNPGNKQLKSILSKLTDLDILLMTINPSKIGSCGIIDKNAELHKLLVDVLSKIMACDENNEISNEENSAEQYLGMIGSALKVVCLSDDYDYSQDMVAVKG